MISKEKLLVWATELQAIAQTGQAYTKDVYDKERYFQCMDLATEMMAASTDEPIDDIRSSFLTLRGYATPKTDVRAFIMVDDKVLLVQEAQDGKWALPGGWADVNHSPAECVMKEVREETGLHVRVNRLMTLWDTAKHDHPPHWPYIYKCVFDCHIESGEFKPSHEILNVGFFDIAQLPELSTHRITESQINQLYQYKQQQLEAVVFD